MQVIVLIVIILFFPAPPLYSENILEPGIPLIRNFKPGEYNAHPQNGTILQDNRGVMYFGNTNRVLIEYDGSQ